MSSRPIATSGAATAASSKRTRRAANTSTVADQQIAGILDHAVEALWRAVAARCSTRSTDKSNFALVIATGSERAVTPPD